MREAFLIVMMPDKCFRERHYGTKQSAHDRAAEWLITFNHSRTAEQSGKQDAALVYRIKDFPGQTYGQIVSSGNYITKAT